MLQPASVTLDGHVKPGAAAHGPIDAITIPDAHLLFSGDFKRAGTDLILSDETQQFVVHDYFRGEHHPTLLSPDGAGLAADVVDALTGHGAYAQAAATPNAVVAVGRVAEVAGSATIVRNGVAITANAGDALLKGDVLQTGAGTLGVTFNDGSTLNLTANSRLMVDDFVYEFERIGEFRNSQPCARFADLHFGRGCALRRRDEDHDAGRDHGYSRHGRRHHRVGRRQGVILRGAERTGRRHHR